jgi:hypothetical protein
MHCCYITRDKELSKGRFHKLPALIHRDSDTASSSLCSGCDSLDLPSIVARMRNDTSSERHVALPPWTNSAGIPVTDSACALCAMFTANWDPEGEVQIRWMESIYFGDTDTFSPWSPAAVVFYDRGWTTKAIFEIIPSRDDHLDPMSRWLDPDSIDIDRIRLWMQSCSKANLALQHHQKTDHLPGFRLIHCKSREIAEPSQKCLYVALSYVWGKELSEESQSRRFPQTIEDAIRVCLKLGFEYLCTFVRLRKALGGCADHGIFSTCLGIDRYVSMPRACPKLLKKL